MADRPLSRRDLSLLKQFVCSRRDSPESTDARWAGCFEKLLAELNELQRRVDTLASTGESPPENRSDTTIL